MASRRSRTCRRATADARTARLEPDENATAVAEAFKLRANGATVMEVREHLSQHGVKRSFHGVQALLQSRILLGELRFGAIVNEHAHEAIVDRDTWRRVQRQIVAARPSPEVGAAAGPARRAALRHLRRSDGHRHDRAGTTSEAVRVLPVQPHLGLSAKRDDQRRRRRGDRDRAVKEILTGLQGTASADTGLASARADVERTENDLDAAVRAFSGLDDVDAARERLAALRDARDAARDRLDELQAAVAAGGDVTADDWDLLTLAERRDLIRAVVDRAVVAPGRGTERITVEPRT